MYEIIRNNIKGGIFKKKKKKIKEVVVLEKKS